MLTELFMGISGVLAAIVASLIICVCTLFRENTSLSDTVEAYQKDDKTIHDMEREVQEKDEQIKQLKYLLHEANERADRNAAIAQGLTEELAALEEIDLVCREVIEYLQKQEPSVMTLEEVRDSDDWMWIEYLSGYAEWNKQSDIFGYYDDGVMWNDSTFASNDSYGIEWRCWTSRPTPEQMRETKWEGDEK